MSDLDQFILFITGSVEIGIVVAIFYLIVVAGLQWSSRRKKETN